MIGQPGVIFDRGNFKVGTHLGNIKAKTHLGCIKAKTYLGPVMFARLFWLLKVWPNSPEVCPVRQAPLQQPGDAGQC